MKFLFTGLTLLAVLPWANAQTTIYGSLGSVWRNSTNVDAAGSSRSEITGSNLGAGVLGLRGVEEIGAGWQARFKLESGFFLDTGAQRNGGIFGRESSVGLDSPYGKLDLGRLQLVGNAAETLVRADPLRGAGQFETVWPGIWSGARFDSALRYRLERGPWFGSAMSSFGRPGTSYALAGGYLGSPLMVMGAWQGLRDASGLASRVLTIGATYTWPSFTLHGAYMHAERDKGFLIGAAPGATLFNTDLGFAGIKAPADQDSRVLLLGLTVPISAEWRLRTAAFLGTSPHSTLFSATQGGTQRSMYAMLSYEFSKRTLLMLEVDYNRWSGGWGRYWGASAFSLGSYKPDGWDTRRTTSLGLLHNF